MKVDEPSGPSRIVAFDAERLKREPVDLESPFFTIKTPKYRECDHTQQGVTLDMSTRTATCLCGVVIDSFDALLVYARAQQRLVHTKASIDEYNRKEVEKRERRRFVRRVTGTERVDRGRFAGFMLVLECGHKVWWDRRREPRKATCATCAEAAKTKDAALSV